MARAYAGCPSTWITRGRWRSAPGNAKRRKSLAAVRSRFGDSMKSIVSPAESTARYRDVQVPATLYRSHPPSRNHWDAAVRAEGADSTAAVAVGTAISPCPPHRPVRALLAHTVLTSDVRMFGAETCIGIGVQDLDWWQQRFQAGHKALPAHAMSLASAPQRLQPAPQHVIAKRSQPRQVARCGVILEVPPHHLLQPFHGSRYACVQALAQLYSYFFELRCHALTDRLPTNREFTRLVVRPTNVGET